MVAAKNLACHFALTLGLALLGCVGLPTQPTPPQPPPRPDPVSPADPRMRIADNAVAQAKNDIPVVPVPPPPLGRPADPKPAPPKGEGNAGVPLRPSGPPAVSTKPAPAADKTPVPPRGEGNAPGGLGNDPAPHTPRPLRPSATPTLRQIHQQAAGRYADIDSYIARLTRREQVRGKNQPEEILLFKFRKEPWSVYFKWLGANGRGREVLYVKNQYENKIHTLLAAGDHPFMAAGNRISLAVDSILVRSASRHPITAAGIGASIDRIGSLLDAVDRGDKRRGTLNNLGPQTRPEFPKPVYGVEQVIPPGAEPELPRGGRRLYCFDPESHLPVLVTTHDDKGQEVEYYRYDRIQYPVKLDDDDFNPDKMWSKPQGK